MARSSDRAMADLSDESDVEVASNIVADLQEIDRSTSLRRIQKQKVDEWIHSDEGHQSILKSTLHNKNEEGNISISDWAFENHERIVKNPRQYQLDLFERAKTQNTIAVLHTGTGKTLIAILLICHVINEELNLRSSLSGLKTCFFLVPTVILAYQQHDVLEHNIDHPVARICGEDHPEEWSAEKWRQVMESYKIIVCTADVLLHALARGYVNFMQVNLLIFDEAHHTKKNHAYSRIIKDFYLSTELRSRPRVFGMTASPVEGKGDVVQAAKQLETLLDSRIATTPNFGLGGLISLPSEHVLYFPPSAISSQHSEFFIRMKSEANGYDNFDENFRSAENLTLDLGVWCADQTLADCLSGRFMQRRKRQITDQCYSENKFDVEELNRRMAYLVKVEEQAVVLRELFGAPDFDGMSLKVQTLVNYLVDSFNQKPHQRCIVFVQTRSTARSLAKLTASMRLPNIRAGHLVGFNAPEEDNDIAFRRQKTVLVKFRRGELNCIFATSVAEEGLDIPDCNLVIRFDLYSTMIQYVQSRGRARKQGSLFIHMLETGNVKHEELHSQTKSHEDAMRQVCRGMPEESTLNGDLDILDTILGKEKGHRTFVVKSTGAKLTYGNAPLHLSRFVSALPQQAYDNFSPMYDDVRVQQDFLATVHLPGSAPLQRIQGKPQRSRALAKRSAAFSACLELHHLGVLDEHLKPIYSRQLPKMGNALLSTDLVTMSLYPMLFKPELWDIGRGTIPTHLFGAIVHFPEGIGFPYQAIMLLTRSKLLQFPVFPVFLDSGKVSNVHILTLNSVMLLDTKNLHQLTGFTYRVFDDLFSKKFEQDPAALTYWFAPVLSPLTSFVAEDLPNSLIDWGVLDRVSQSHIERWTPDILPETLVDRVIIDPQRGGLKFYSIEIMRHLRPSDQVPSELKLIKHSHAHSTIIANSVSGSKDVMEKTSWDIEQPVILAEMISCRRDTLSAPKEWTGADLCCLCPEPLSFSLIPKRVAVALYLLPGILHRIESYLVANAICEKLQLDCKLDVALAAITKIPEKSNDRDSDSQGDVQDGMGEGYERLEFLGDTFLKLATSLSIFLLHPDVDQFHSHVARMVMLCNKNLFQVGSSEFQLYKYIRSKGFSRRFWYPDGLKLLKGKSIAAKDVHKNHSLSQKTIADVSEALIGAAFLSHNDPSQWKSMQWTEAIRAVTILVRNDDHPMQKWQDYIDAYVEPSYLKVAPSAVELHVAREVETKHPYRFRNPRLLISAFTHPSCTQLGDFVPVYERLEYLGDALLDMSVVTHIFYRFPKAGPQRLTELKMAMVSNRFFGALCVDLQLHKHLRHATASLSQAITDYAQELQIAKNKLGAKHNYWVGISEPPKCLADVIEAYVAAIFVDSGFDYGEVQRFFDQHIMPYFEDMDLYDSYANHSSRDEVRKFFNDRYGCQAVDLMANEVPSLVQSKNKHTVVAVVMAHEHIIAHGVRGSVYAAKADAVAQAMDECQGLTQSVFRERFGCDCVNATRLE